MKQVLVLSAVLVATLIVAEAPARAAKRTVWTGRDVDNPKVFWTCSNVGGNDWKLKKAGKDAGDYEGVTSTADFVELQLKGSKKFQRVRLYKDKLSINKEGSKTEWLEKAKGKWND